jgi:hypothetical protein
MMAISSCLVIVTTRYLYYVYDNDNVRLYLNALSLTY